MSKRASKAEYEQRLVELGELLAARAPRRSVVQYAMNKWGVGERAAQGYVLDALARLRREAGVDPATEFALADAGYKFLFRRQLASNDLRGARGTLDKHVILLGLATRQPERPFTFEAVEAEIARLEGDLGDIEGRS